MGIPEDGTSVSRYDPLKWFKLGMLMLFGITILSTVVYWVLGGVYEQPAWTLVNCLFFVVITLSTIGYEDLLGVKHFPLAKAYTMFLMVGGVAVHAFFISNVTALFMEGLFHDMFRRRRMKKQIETLENHIIVCGAGSLGAHCIEELQRTGRDFVAIDRNENILLKLVNEIGEFIYIVDEADDDDVLAKARIKQAHGLVACLSDDKDNLFVTLSARRMNPKLRIVSRAILDNAGEKLLAAGTDRVVNPSAIGGMRLVSEMIRPTVVGFLDTMLRDPHQKYRFEELNVESGCDVEDKTLAEANIRSVGDLLVVAGRTGPEQPFVYNPKADYKLNSGCTLVVLGQNEDLKKLRPYFLKEA